MATLSGMTLLIKSITDNIKDLRNQSKVFLYSENHALDAWFRRGFADKEEIKTPLLYNESAVGQLHKKHNKGGHLGMSINDINSLSHTKWNCKYHIVFAPKYRRKVFYGEKRKEVGKILRQLCEWKGVKIVEAEVCPDHVHMLLEIPPKISVSSFMGYLKGKSSTMLYEQFGELKYKYRSREFWCKGYYVDTAGKNTSRIAEYIANQLKEDKLGEQLAINENSPFTGSK